MKFQNFLVEQEYDISEITKTLEKKCKPFLRDLVEHLKKNNLFRVQHTIGDATKFNSRFLFSGRNKNEDYFTGTIRKNRTPVDTPEEVQTFIDDWFDDKFGLRPRSNSLFCTGSPKETMRYGDLFAIFPIGEYEIIWSEEVKDFYMALGSKINPELLVNDNPSYEDLIDDENELEFYKKQGQEKYEKQGWGEYGDYFSLEDDEYEAQQEIYQEVKDEENYSETELKRKYLDILSTMKFKAPVSFEEFMQGKIEEGKEEEDVKFTKIMSTYQKGNLSEAILSRNEIMLVGDKYVAVQQKYFDDILNGLKEKA